MKTAVLALFAIALLAGACSKKAQDSSQTRNPEFKVDFLFEHDGCKVYRFEDGGYNRYFTTCQGSASHHTRHGSHKARYSRHHEVPTQIIEDTP